MSERDKAWAEECRVLADLREMADQISRGHMPPSAKIMGALRQAANAMDKLATGVECPHGGKDPCIWPACACPRIYATITPKDTP